jgi:hypothetical protein
MLGLKILSLETFEQLCADSEVLEKDGHGDKVLRLTDGSIVKLFRRKRLISSAVWSPYARRFASNCLIVGKLGIPVPDVIDTFRVPAIKRDAVRYRPVPGSTLRQLVRTHNWSADEEAIIREQFTEFVRHLYELGIYFRSLHLGNVVLLPDGRLGLIDLADLTAYRRPLNTWIRKRSIARMRSIASDTERDWIDATQLEIKSPSINR